MYPLLHSENLEKLLPQLEDKQFRESIELNLPENPLGGHIRSGQEIGLQSKNIARQAIEKRNQQLAEIKQQLKVTSETVANQGMDSLERLKVISSFIILP